MNILILGAGYIGNHVYSKLERDLVPAGVISKIWLKSRKQLDYTDKQTLVNFISSEQINIVICATGYTGRPNVDACETDKQQCWLYNVKTPLIIESACQTPIHTTNGWMKPPKLIHISSGCIYTGYDKNWTEQDDPNFGLYNHSSWYSKTKHAAETLMNTHRSTILRIRMPFSACDSPRNIIHKFFKYDNLVSYLNSMTCVEDLCSFIDTYICRSKINGTNIPPPGIYNVVHNQPTSARNIVSKIQKHVSREFNFTDIEHLNLSAPRSNCTLSAEKISSYNMQLPDINESLDRCIEKLFSSKKIK